MTPSLRDRLAIAYRLYGQKVSELVPGLEWHVELHDSKAYDLVAMLIFAPAGDAEDEVAVVTFYLVRGGRSWIFDIVGRGSRILLGPVTGPATGIEQADGIIDVYLAPLLDAGLNLLTADLRA